MCPAPTVSVGTDLRPFCLTIARPPTPYLRHLRAGALEGLGHPISVRESASEDSLNLQVHVILHTPDCWHRPIHQEVCSAAIPVVRKTDAACVGDDTSRN